MSHHDPITRRRFLLGIGAVGAAGLGARFLPEPRRSPALAADSPPPPTTTSAPNVPVASTTSTTEPVAATTTQPAAVPTTEAPSASFRPYVPDARDVYVEVKEPAGRFVQLLATDRGDSGADRVVGVIAETGALVAAPEIELVARPLLEPGASAEIVYSQLGGLAPAADPTASSIMVVCRQHFTDGTESTRTVDVRMARDADGWRVVGLASAGGEPVSRPARLSQAAELVLDDPRITLPDSARWDVHEGIVDDRLLQTMSAMAEQAPFAVTCFRNGHPIRVFGTERYSHHTSGAAVDVWGVGGTLVAAQQPDPSGAAHDLQRWLFDSGIRELGGPWDFDGQGGRSFTNEVHLDHIHVAFQG